MKKRNPLLVISTIFIITLLFSNYQVQSHEARIVEFKVATSKNSGIIQEGVQLEGEDSVEVKMFANKHTSGQWILVVFPGIGKDPQIAGRPVANLENVLNEKGTSPKYIGWKNPGPIWQTYTDADTLLIPPGDIIHFNVLVDFLRQEDGGVSPRLHGKAYLVNKDDLRLINEAPERLAQFYIDQQPDSEFDIDLYYRIFGEKWVSGSFESVFGKPSNDKHKAPQTGDYLKDFFELPVVIGDYRKKLSLPGNFKDDGGALFKKTLGEVLNAGTGELGDSECDDEKNDKDGEIIIDFPEKDINDIEVLPFPQDKIVSPSIKSQTLKMASHLSSHTLTGRFSTKWTSDHSLHPGFGWRVEAWTQEKGFWEILASDWVQWDGAWLLQVPSAKGYLGNHLRIYYRSYNSYFEPQNKDGNKYSWKDPDQSNIGSLFDAGHRYADTDGGSANGLGELYDAGLRMWSQLYWDGGINPVPSSPLKVYFPNTWYNCSGSSPWSCASTDGKVWLIATHGTDAPTVAHEFAHQLNFKFWNNKLPAGSGGSHSLNSCYPTRLGMALTEGFANFVAGWVGYRNRNVTEGGFNFTRWNLGYDLETRLSPPDCFNGWENEVWVARTFWDLHDKRSDGDDILWFIHKGAVISLYLSNGIANNGDAKDMRDYENTYRNAASSGHQGFISDIFNQNRH